MEQPHPLAEWLSTTGEPQSVFARKVEVSESHLSLILSRKRGASLNLARRIERATNGKVKAVDLPQPEAVA
jgi:DNA-binding transcriptional regulator YdaS (Cro superfamily)